jgi:hypothetical protein
MRKSKWDEYFADEVKTLIQEKNKSGATKPRESTNKINS